MGDHGMDKDLMALLGYDDSAPKDEGLITTESGLDGTQTDSSRDDDDNSDNDQVSQHDEEEDTTQPLPIHLPTMTFSQSNTFASFLDQDDDNNGNDDENNQKDGKYQSDSTKQDTTSSRGLDASIGSTNNNNNTDLGSLSYPMPRTALSNLQPTEDSDEDLMPNMSDVESMEREVAAENADRKRKLRQSQQAQPTLLATKDKIKALAERRRRQMASSDEDDEEEELVASKKATTGFQNNSNNSNNDMGDDNSMDVEPTTAQSDADTASTLPKTSKQTPAQKVASKTDKLASAQETERLIRSSTFALEQRYQKRTMADLLEKVKKGQELKKQLPPKVIPVKKVIRPTVISLGDSEDDEKAEREAKQAQPETKRGILIDNLLKPTHRQRINGAPSGKSRTPPGTTVSSTSTSASLPSSLSSLSISAPPTTTASGPTTTSLSSKIDSLMTPKPAPQQPILRTSKEMVEWMRRKAIKDNRDRMKKRKQEAKKDRAEDEYLGSGSEVDLGSGAEEMEGEEEDGEGEKGVSHAGVDDEAGQDEDDEEDEEDEDEDEDDEEDQDGDDEEEDQADEVVSVRAKRRTRKIIQDDDEVTVTVVDSAAASYPNLFDVASPILQGDDEDMMDMEESQGLGEFFESSYNPARRTTTTTTATTVSSSIKSPTVRPSNTQFDNVFDGSMSFLSGEFPKSQTVFDKMGEPSQMMASFGGGGSEGEESEIEREIQGDLSDEDNNGDDADGDDEEEEEEVEEDDDEVVEADGEQPVNIAPLFLRTKPQQTHTTEHKRLEQRIGKTSSKPKLTAKDKSAFIEYEAEEEEDEHMGKGGIDHEGDLEDEDRYDMTDGMVVTNVDLKSQDVRKVRQLAAQQEQDQHNREVSDLVHGIAAGNLWKRRKGGVNGDDMDIFDEDELDGYGGGVRRTKKYKLSEAFVKLADNPATAAFARAFEKGVGEEELMFLTEPMEMDGEEGGGEKDKSENDEDEDEDEDEVEGVAKNGNAEEEDEEEDEPLDASARMARIQRIAASMGHDELTTTKKVSVKASLELEEEDDDERDEEIEDYEAIFKRKQAMLNILSGEADMSVLVSEDEEEEEIQELDENGKITIRAIATRKTSTTKTTASSSSSTTTSAFEMMMQGNKHRDVSSRIVDGTSVANISLDNHTSTARNHGTGSIGGGGGGHEDQAQVHSKRRLISSSFTTRRKEFLSTVGGDDGASLGSNGQNNSNRVVKEVNKKRMAFATGKKQQQKDQQEQANHNKAGQKSGSSHHLQSGVTTATSTTKPNLVDRKVAGVPGLNRLPSRLMDVLERDG